VAFPDHRETIGVGDRARDDRAVVLVGVHTPSYP
jgi:hypothetical protein